MPIVGDDDGFPHRDPKYRTGKDCLGAHCLPAAKRIGNIYAVFNSFMILLILLEVRVHGIFIGKFFQIPYYGLNLLTAVLFFIGIRKFDKNLVQPFVFLNLLLCFFYSFLGLICFLSILWPTYWLGRQVKSYFELSSVPIANREELRDVCLISVVICGLAGLLTLYFYFILRQCYVYLKEYEDYRKARGQILWTDDI